MELADRAPAAINLIGRLRRRRPPAAAGSLFGQPARTPKIGGARTIPIRAGAAGARDVQPAPVPVPRSARIRIAFQEMPPTPTERLVLRALADHPGRNSTYLSRICGWHGAIWHTHLAAISHKRMKWLFDDEDTSGAEDFLYGTLASYDPGSATFLMRPEAEIALTGLRIIDAPQ